MIRPAEAKDISGMHRVRMSVTENALNNEALASKEKYLHHLEVDGQGWVYEVNGQIVGFSIVDLRSHSIWALFVHPEFEGRGIGRQLHDTMLTFYFEETNFALTLTTAAHSRAEKFYTRAGWLQNGMVGDELLFEMTAARYQSIM